MQYIFSEKNTCVCFVHSVYACVRVRLFACVYVFICFLVIFGMLSERTYAQAGSPSLESVLRTNVPNISYTPSSPQTPAHNMSTSASPSAYGISNVRRPTADTKSFPIRKPTPSHVPTLPMSETSPVRSVSPSHSSSPQTSPRQHLPLSGVGSAAGSGLSSPTAAHTPPYTSPLNRTSPARPRPPMSLGVSKGVLFRKRTSANMIM